MSDCEDVEEDGSDRMSCNVDDSDEIFDDDDDDCSMEVCTKDSHHSGPSNMPESCYVKLTADDIVKEQRKLIQNVVELTKLPGHTARQLLQEMKWSFENVAVLYYDDQDKLFAKAGISVNGEAIDAVAVRGSSGSFVLDQQTITCQVCLEDFEREEAEKGMSTASGCGHVFCNACWVRHITTQVKEGQAARISCAGETFVEGKRRRCNIILDECFVEELLRGSGGSAEILKKYQTRLIDSYVNNNPTIKWCPATDCTNAIRVTDSFDPSSFDTSVECSDGHVWCFNCLDEPHAPAECSNVKEWRKKCQEDSATSNWLVAYTKDCPNCKVAINKDGGCNHMHCKHCDHHFCWVCLGIFEHKTYQHTCNKFVDDESKMASGRTALQRYTHYYERFNNHSKSRELESKLQEDAMFKMKKMQEDGNKTYMDVQFMKQATSQLINARRILQWTYVVGFYDPPWLQRNIFDLNQSELENATEKLSNMLETEDVIKWCDPEDRVEMINQTNQVETRVKHLLDALDTWKTNFSESDRQDMVEASNSQEHEEAGEAGSSRKSGNKRPVAKSEGRGSNGRRPNKKIAQAENGGL
mmetsp:Transcript_50785/g.158688  ORF Transcript_50785/g.158688 Transcript_50785/m.158688 type:complete len:584 (+) Transcript_50785:83-1834(+)